MKMFWMLWLGLRLRSPFRLVFDGDIILLRPETLPNDDTGIVTLTVDRTFIF